MIGPNYKNKYLIAIVLFCVFVLGLVHLFFSDHIFVSKILTENRPETGYLYKFTDLENEKRYMVVSDTLVSPENFNTVDYKVDFLDTSYIWNPKTCAKMPTLIDQRGNIFMLETSFQDNTFSKKLILFNAETKLKKYFDISNWDIVSPLFLVGERIGFLTKTENHLYLKSFDLQSFDRALPFLSVKLLGIGKMKLVVAKQNEFGEVLVTTSQDLVKKQYFQLSEDALGLVDVTNEHENREIEVNLSEATKLKNGDLPYYSQENELVSGIVSSVAKSQVKYFTTKPTGFFYVINSF